jgi:hypothetical protein
MKNPCNLRNCIFLAVFLLIVCPPNFAQTTLTINFSGVGPGTADLSGGAPGAMSGSVDATSGGAGFTTSSNFTYTFTPFDPSFCGTFPNCGQYDNFYGGGGSVSVFPQSGIIYTGRFTGGQSTVDVTPQFTDHHFLGKFVLNGYSGVGTLEANAGFDEPNFGVVSYTGTAVTPEPSSFVYALSGVAIIVGIFWRKLWS